MQRMVVVPLLLKAEIESESIIGLFAGPALSWINIWLLCHGTLYLVPVIPLSVWEGLVGWWVVRGVFIGLLLYLVLLFLTPVLSKPLINTRFQL